MDFNNLTDEQLVLIIREKDRELYGEIIRRYKDKLTRYLRKFFRDADEIEDILQITFIKAYRNLFDFNVKRKFSSWIYRIAHNEAINHLRKKSKGPIPLDEFDYRILDEKIDIARDVDGDLFKKEMEAALGDLELKYREPLILFYFEQKSYEEISDILRLPKNTVGTLIARGKKVLGNSLRKIDKMANL